MPQSRRQAPPRQQHCVSYRVALHESGCWLRLKSNARRNSRVTGSTARRFGPSLLRSPAREGWLRGSSNILWISRNIPRRPDAPIASRFSCRRSLLYRNSAASSAKIYRTLCEGRQVGCSIHATMHSSTTWTVARQTRGERPGGPPALVGDSGSRDRRSRRLGAFVPGPAPARRCHRTVAAAAPRPGRRRRERDGFQKLRFLTHDDLRGGDRPDPACTSRGRSAFASRRRSAARWAASSAPRRG